MLLLQLDQYHRSAYVIPSFRDEGDHYEAKFIRFEKLPDMYRKSFEHFELHGHKLVSFLNVPEGTLAEAAKNVPSLADLMIWFVNRNIQTRLADGVTFDQWIEDNIRIRHSTAALHQLFVTYDGKTVMCYLQHGKIQVVEITETSFIRNGVVTWVTTAMELYRQRAEQDYKSVVASNAKLLDDKGRWHVDLVNELCRSRIPDFAHHR